MGLVRGAISVVISLLLASCPDATHAACALQTRSRHTRDAKPGATCRISQGCRKEGGNAAGGTTACFPSPHLLPHGRKKCSPTRQGKAARRKKPQPGTVGVSPYKLPSLSLERTSQRSVGQVSWLAAALYSLHLPKAKHLSGPCRFRSAHSCGAAMDLHHLPWSQPEAATNPTSGVFDSGGEHTAAPVALSRTFLQGAPGGVSRTKP